MDAQLKDETLCDIIAEKRRLAQEIRDKANDTFWDIVVHKDESKAEELEHDADRLDRARMKMEIEMANLRKENAKLRGALKLAMTMSDWCCAETDDPLECCVHNCIYQKEPHGEAGKKCPWKKIRAALATPRHLEAASLQDAPAN